MAKESVIDFIRLSHLKRLEKRLSLITESIAGRHTIPLISDSGRNVLLVKMREDRGKLDFNFVWGIMHGHIREILKEEKYRIKRFDQVTGVSINEDGCFFKFLITSAPNLSLSVSSFRWHLEPADLVGIFRKWLEALDFILSTFMGIMERLDISLGRHIKCSCGDLKYENGGIIHSIFVNDCILPRGELMFRRDKVSVGIGFADLLFVRRWWYQVSGLGEPMESYIRSMLINGDV